MDRIAKFEHIKNKPYPNFEPPRLPARATKGSAGYDFFAPCDIVLPYGQSVKIPTGIRVRIKEGWCLVMAPKSGLGSKFRLQLDNTLGLIDSDYYYSDNEGHIMLSLTNDNHLQATLFIHKGQAFVQGVFLPFGITEDDEAEGVRNGGFGSTG